MPEVALLDLHTRRRALAGYGIGMVLYALTIVALYPSFRHDSSLDQLTAQNPTVAALFGATGSLTTSPGWLNANLYGNFLPLVVLLLTIGYGASCIAGQNEDGTLGLIVTLPISRRRIAVEKFSAMCLQAAIISIVTALCVLAGRWFGLSVGWVHLSGITIGVLLLGIDFGLFAMLIGSVTGNRGSALGITSGIAAAGYLISSLAPAVHWIRPARYASPFFYAVGDGQLLTGLGLGNLLALTGGAVALLAALVRRFEHLEVR